MKSLIGAIFFCILMQPYVLHAEIVETKEIDTVEFGVSLFTPGVVNFLIRKEFKATDVNLAVGYIGENTHGVELGVTLIRNPGKFFRSFQLISGRSSIERSNSVVKKWTYVGMSTSLRNGGFLLEPGLTMGKGDYSKIQLALQLGWLW